jgi:hypothetical protein
MTREEGMASYAHSPSLARRNGEEDNLAMELPRLLEMCFG